jgi:hypothetical protein
MAALAALALAGCGDNGGSGAHPSGSSSASASGSAAASADSKAKAMEVAKCMRANGFPNQPDPVLDDNGDWTFPASADAAAAPPPCDAAIRAWKASTSGGRGPSAEEMAQRRAYAKCIRTHGVADFPDPDSDGNFPLTAEQRAQAGSPQAREAQHACASLAPPRDPNKPAPGSS